MIKIQETDERFEIGESRIPGAGFGLFAAVPIKKNDYLEIIGVMVDVGETSHICTKFANFYKFAAEPLNEFCHAVIPCGYAALVNHADSPANQNVAISHMPTDRVPRNKDSGRVVYMAIRDIRAGEEILGNYNRKGLAEAAKKEDDLMRWKQLLEINFYGLKRINK